MRCPFCGHDDTQVKDSRPTEDNTAIRRRRYCPNCGARFTTFERVQLRELTVIKKNGQRTPFDRDKLARSIQIATRKRDIIAGRSKLVDLTAIIEASREVVEVFLYPANPDCPQEGDSCSCPHFWRWRFCPHLLAVKHFAGQINLGKLLADPFPKNRKKPGRKFHGPRQDEK